MLNSRSMKRLEGVHPDLVKVVLRAAELSDVQFIITEGLRSPERQKRLFESGASRTLKSRHLTGHAVDVAALVDGAIVWSWHLYPRIAAAFKAAAAELSVPIVWGGSWPKFRDGPHFELSSAVYR
ncbi:peptidase [Apis mellifera associated microvirus 3]|nr:peptidase [Apis mellifera associated microvirus 3]AZL82769.1 peptidase [Apis mellifera associated microvirus 3]